MSRQRKRGERTYEVIQGYACRCDACESERRGESQLYRLDHWCAGCGHGYACGPPVRGEGGCYRCGQHGAWLDKKPVLPFMPKAEAIDRVLLESRGVVDRLLEVYRPEYVQQVCESDPFSLIARAKRLESALAQVDRVKVQEVRS